MQPTYLPWAGYFHILNSVDQFVFLDDVQFDRRSWQSRNRVLLNGNAHWLTVPTKKCDMQTRISDVRIDNSQSWQQKHWKTLNHGYKSAPYSKVALDILQPFYNDLEFERLSSLTESIIERICEALEISTRLLKASNLSCRGKRSSHLSEICKAIDSDTYVSPLGSQEYLKKDAFTALSGVDLVFQDFKPGRYEQIGAPGFVSHLSIIDVIANIGLDASKTYIV